MANTASSGELIKQLKDLLSKGNAHATLDDAICDIPEDIRAIVPDKLPYSIWQIMEHIRICQWDILDFSRNPDYKEMDWPADYWPKEAGPKDEAAWDNSIQQIKKDREDFIKLLEKDDVDLYTPFPWGSGQNLLRETLLVADHNSYHTGELIVLRRLLGNWK
jgi:uncharacterized damage-inducible protein DinB